MGDCSEGIEASGGSGSRKAHHVGISPPEDRGGTKIAMGQGTGGAEEGGLEPAEPITRIVPHNCSSVKLLAALLPLSMLRIRACAPVRSSGAVSYTHLDVYKRQLECSQFGAHSRG